MDAANQVSGSVENVVQASHIHGDVNVYGSRAADVLPCRFGPVPPLAGGYQRRAVPDTRDCVVLSGSGGHGKTQLAAGLAEDQWLTGELGLLAWITASSRDGLVSAYADLAHRLTGDDMPTDRAVRWALGWLGETTTAWLVVLDDVRDPRDLDGLWPPPNGRVLVTTRRQDSELVGHGRRRVPVDLFTPEESRTCLSAHLDPPLMFGAEELASALGHLPLAVGHAGAYMADRNLTCAQYLTRWRTKPLRELFPAHTWQLSIELANSLEPAGLAAPLLHIAAVLDPRGIPITALTSQPVLDDLSTTREDAWDALGCLNRLSLITFDDKTIRLHPVVQRATWEQAGPKQSAAQVAADALAAAWPASDDPLAATFRDNTAFLTKRTGSSLWRNGVHSVLFKAGNSLGEAGHPADAQAYFATLFTKVDRSHSSGLTIRHNIAYWRAAAGDLVTALTELESVLADQVREIGREHPSTLNTRHNIAQFRAEAGERAAGLTELEAVLADLIRTRGPHHPATEKTRAAITKWRFRAE